MKMAMRFNFVFIFMVVAKKFAKRKKTFLSHKMWVVNCKLLLELSVFFFGQLE